MRPEGVRRTTLRILLGLVILGVTATAAVGVTPRATRAWNAGWSGGTTLIAYNTGTFEFASFPYTVSSSIYYVEVWDGSGQYARIDQITHQVKTNSNWYTWAGYLYGYALTEVYSGGGYVWTYSNVGSCLISPWTFWWCSSGSAGGVRIYGSGSGRAWGTLYISGGGWGVYGGASASGWFSFS